MIETKQVAIWGSPKGEKSWVKEYNECLSYIDDLTAFGWTATQETTQYNGRASTHYQIMARETSIPNYDELSRLEMSYEEAKVKIKTYEPAEFSTAVLLLLLLVIPGVLYLVFKGKKKSSIRQNNEKCKEEMKNAVTKARSLK